MVIEDPGSCTHFLSVHWVIQRIRGQVVFHILRLGRHQLVDSVQLATRASLFALFYMREGCMDPLLALVVIVLNVFLSPVQQIKTAGNDDGDNPCGAVGRNSGVSFGTHNRSLMQQYRKIQRIQ